jgi:dTDP-4-dehydrorhamnose reductase
MKILLLGKNGQIGQAIQHLSHTSPWPIGWELVAWDREQGDLANAEKLIAAVEKLKPDTIINAAAYTQVDKAETEQEICRAINTIAPEKLAQYCAAREIPFLHYSTDYVYEGTGTNPHLENEKYRPQNFYGLSKSQGDDAIVKAGGQYLIFRTSWVYSHAGKNFLLTMLKLGGEREQLKIVDDQVGSPSYAPDLAKYTLDALMKSLELKTANQRFPAGIYHLCNAGYTTWLEFAQNIFASAREQGMNLAVKDVSGIATAAYPTPAKRPLNSRLSLHKLQQTFHTDIRDWQSALREAIAEVKKENNPA